MSVRVLHVIACSASLDHDEDRSRAIPSNATPQLVFNRCRLKPRLALATSNWALDSYDHVQAWIDKPRTLQGRL